MAERRKFARMNLNTMVECEKIDSSEPPGQFESKDISVGGMCLIVDERIKTGDKLSLKIKLLTSKTIHAKGKVIRIEDRQEKKYIRIPAYPLLLI